jgi:hypothetical protein
MSMFKNPPTTAEIAAFRALNKDFDMRLVDWAFKMLESGHDTEALRILSGETTPFNQFEIQTLVDQALQELGITPIPHRDAAAKTLASIRVQEALDGKSSTEATLSELSRLYVELNHHPDIQNFYLLHFASKDLKNNDVQWYWPDANKDNIDQVVKDYFRSWITAHPGNI